MKIVGIILKIVAALAAIAGIVYVVATYGDKIVLWAKKLLGICDCDDCQCEDDCDDCACEGCCNCGEAEEVVVEEAPAEEAAPVEEDAVQAEEADFEG